LLVYPHPLFAYEMSHAGIVVHATRPIPPAMRWTLERVRVRIDATTIGDSASPPEVFICDPPWLFALFARTNYRVGGVADWFVGQHVYLRSSDMQHDRLIGPSGRPVADDRPLSYFIAHEIMHIVHARALGRLGYARLPQWLDDGHADYIAREIDLGAALSGLKSGARELDPQRSGLYIRYHLMVAYLINKKGLSVPTLMEHPLAAEPIETELRQLKEW
jgi:hypothetical protein